MLIKAFSAFLLAATLSAPAYWRVLENMGYNASRRACEAVELTIPKEWGKVFENYNELQKQGGFDLSPYKGKRCTRYTYEIPELNARGNILVLEGKVIGGDVCSITIDGIMLPIEKDKLK